MSAAAGSRASDGQALTPFGSPAFYHQAPPFVGHAHQKTMRSLSTQITGLKRHFHDAKTSLPSAYSLGYSVQSGPSQVVSVSL
jgi:hypothetical protein